MIVHAEEIDLEKSILQEDITIEDVNLSNFTMEVYETEEKTTEVDAVTAIKVDEQKEIINVTAKLNQRTTTLLPDNPRINVTGDLTAENTVDFQFFSVSDNKFMVARLLSTNAKYVAQLYLINYETGEATPTNIGDLSGNLIGLNGLPTGDYAFAIYSDDDTVGASYTLQINATNPEGNIVKTVKITNDLMHFVLQYATGEVYGDGTYVYNINTMNQANKHLEWNREEDVNWTGGYIHRTHQISDVRIKQVTGPATWTSAAGSSDNVMLVYCDVDTAWMYFHSQYESGSYHYYSFEDTFGRTTPRPLDGDDLLEFSHILAYDLKTGKVIDFYSPLNIYYASGAQSAPVVTFY